ncbi:hypothetical protein DB88DRAFT_470835 [Papiliotrema laurentii]|uniref:Uncharacterized protein n=1 Tax=Papiliotrema laurentii TaxID=5418 RepID=A0AAD9L7U1_PAPLA|nr:hypothetical protein DB88DRAFT_470835 [Papiliotrema laurentii]
MFQLPETFVHTFGESEDDHTASVLNARGLWVRSQKSAQLLLRDDRKVVVGGEISGHIKTGSPVPQHVRLHPLPPSHRPTVPPSHHPTIHTTALQFVGASGPLYKTISDALEDASCRLTGRSPLKPGDVVALPEAAVSLTLGWLLATEQVPHASTLLPLAQNALQTFWRASEHQPGSAPKQTANGASVEGSQIAREYAKQADALLEQCGLSASQPQTFASEVSFHPPATSPEILPPPDLRPLSTGTGPASVSPTAVPPTAVPPESDPEVYKSSAATSPDTVLEKIASTLEMCSGTMRMFEEFMKQMMGGQGPVACRQGEGTDDVSARPISEGCARRDVKEAWFDHWRPSAPNSPTLPGSEAAPSIRAN